MKSAIISEIKERLMGEFKDLKPQKSGKEWRQLLKTFNVWHCSDEAGNVWRNANRGLAGTDGLSRLVSDMKTVLKSEESKPRVKLTPGQIREGRESSIASSSLNLRRRRKGIGVAAK
jgi:hypothetical protein